MATVTIDGVEYVPRAEIPPLNDGALTNCLRELVNIQHFPECSHKHRAWAWNALHALAPELAELAAENSKAAFDRLTPQ
ncbi:hypothetical protein G3A43_08665 [Paraburkholderia aspalathi]|nr:hypothetical protein [Paraburkholderia aspalathi]MBK3780329.1 hypothetical protein [Paraburkholderia aspalathi]